VKLGAITSMFKLGKKEEIYRVIKIIAEIGFDTVDLFIDPEVYSKSEKKRMKVLVKSEGLRIASIATYVPQITSSDMSKRQKAVELLMRRLDFASEMGATNMEAVAGEEEQGIAPRISWQRSVEIMQKVAEYAQKAKIPIAVELEPLLKNSRPLVYDVNSMLRYLKEVGSEYCMANLDVGHCHIMKQSPEDIKKLKDKIVHTHFSDNDGTAHNDWPPGRGNADLEGYLRALKQIGYEGSVAIELEKCPNPIAWAKEGYEYIAKLMDKLDIHR